MRRTSLNDGWTCRPKADRFAELAGTASEPVPVTLPHDAMIAIPRSAEGAPATGYFPGGAWEYARTLERTAESPATAILELEGVYRDAVVVVNGSIAAHRPSGYTGFEVPLDHLLHEGDNELKVECTAHADSRWYPGAGIHRDVWLLEAGPVHLVPGSLVVQTPEVDDDLAVVTVAVDVRNRSTVTAEVRCEVEVVGHASASAPVTVFPGDTVTVRHRLHVTTPRRWTLDDPQLHTCRVRLAGLDEDETTFGIRTLSLDAVRGLRLNGEPVLLRGACIHHDNGPIGAAAIARAEERRVELLKAAGFNAIRSAHNPLSRAMLDACDRRGVLVMDETFDMWAQTKTNDDYALRFEDWWERDVEAMVRKDRNHPSVVFYSVGNEVPDGSTATGLQRGRALAEKVRALDPTRYVVQAVSGMLVAGPGVIDEIRNLFDRPQIDEDTGVNTAISTLGDLMDEAMLSPLVGERTEEAFAHLDAAGYNYMFARFGADGEAHPNRVIVATETHASTVDRGWAGVTDNPHVIGDFVWTGWDYLGEAGIGRITYGDEAIGMGGGFHGPWPWLLAGCGDIDITGFRRPQSYFREIVFGLRTDPYLAVRRPEHHGKVVEHSTPWSWSDAVASWTWPDGAPVDVEVYADADDVELVLNGTSLGRQPIVRFQAEFDVTFESGELEAIAWRGDDEVGRSALRTAEATGVELRVDRAEILADTSDLAFVEILVTGDRQVAVEVDGPGVLQGLASARPDTEEPYTGDTCTTFDGRALAVIRPTGAGTITVRCDGQELVIDVLDRSE